MTEKQSAYRQIFKATSLFGGVQVIGIFTGIIRAKFIAVLLGTSGIGIMGLLTSTTTLVNSITNLGISFSAVRDISEANGTGNINRISRVIISFRRWVWVTGILGSTITLIFAKRLSIFTFGNADYTLAFVWLSITLLMTALSSGQTTLLQGMRRLKEMAKANVFGSIFGLIISIPIYYLYGIRGIVPTIILTALSALGFSWYFARRVNITKIQVSYKESIYDGLGMVKLGIAMTINGFIGTLVAYLVNAYINRTGGVHDVGLYQSGWNITNRYVGLIFTAMSTDFYPRLAAIHHDNCKMRETVNQQAEIALLIIAPILIILLSSTPLVIKILYTKDFLSIIPFVQWVVLGMIFKTVSWCLGFIILSKGNIKLFFLSEMIGVLSLFGGNIIGYHFLGIQGLGISFFLSYLLVFSIVFWVCKKKFSFEFSTSFLKVFIIQSLGCLIAFLFVYFLGFPWAYYTGSVIFVIISLFSFKELDKRLSLLQIIKNYVKR
jgi:O-antigen/teichoic acid export membrane protein